MDCSHGKQYVRIEWEQRWELHGSVRLLSCSTEGCEVEGSKRRGMGGFDNFFLLSF